MFQGFGILNHIMYKEIRAYHILKVKLVLHLIDFTKIINYQLHSCKLKHLLMNFSLFTNPETSNPLNDLLTSKNISLHDVLDCETLIPELKNSNSKLLAFLCQPSIFDALINLITEVPNKFDSDPSQPHRDLKQNKFALVASDILATDNEILCKYFLGIISSREVADNENKLNSDESSEIKEEIEICSDSENNDHEDQNRDANSHFCHFIKFLNKPIPILYTMGGYFFKVMKNLFFTQPEVTSNLIFINYYQIFKKIMVHIYNDSMLEAITPIVFLEPGYFKSPKDAYLSQRLELLNAAINNIYEKPDQSMDDSLFCDLQWNSTLLVSLILIKSTTCAPELPNLITSKEHLQRLFKAIFKPQNIIPTAHLVCSLCEYYAATKSEKEGSIKLDLVNFTNSIPVPKFDQDEPFLLEVVNSLENLVAILEKSEGAPNLNLFQMRLKLLDVFFYFIKLKNDWINQKICSSGLIPLLLNLMKSNPLSDILHQVISGMIKFILEQCSDVLKAELLEKANLLDFIVNESASSEVESVTNGKKKVQKSYLAHLIEVANLINSSLNAKIKTERISNQKWQGFTESTLKRKNFEKSIKIGGDPVCDKSYKQTREIKRIDEADNGPADKSLITMNLVPSGKNGNTGNANNEEIEELIEGDEETKEQEGKEFENVINLSDNNSSMPNGLGNLSSISGIPTIGFETQNQNQDFNQSPKTPAGRRKPTNQMSFY